MAYDFERECSNIVFKQYLRIVLCNIDCGRRDLKCKKTIVKQCVAYDLKSSYVVYSKFSKMINDIKMVL